ncbi:hypothetical protein CWB58_11020 [Pseudoalteromonas sp. S201]|nr:hypothetical protein CWB58_11020 [Pseudoalteromonas sp. S201]
MCVGVFIILYQVFFILSKSILKQYSYYPIIYGRLTANFWQRESSSCYTLSPLLVSSKSVVCLMNLILALKAVKSCS